MREMMELYIETLTGTAFELRVSPYETVQDVKVRIQKLEGIPVSQQHLIWQSIDLEDDYSLQDYSIHDGATLKLVLTMRGGPINTRRIPVEDPTIREMAEYLSDAHREELIEKVPGNRPVTVIVYHNGDQLNFFRVVDRDSPLSDTSASMYNILDEDDDDDDEVPGKETVAENDKMKEKVLQLRHKMESMSLSKKPRKVKHAPRPPSQGRPGSKNKIRRFPSYAGKKSTTFTKGVLPPVTAADATVHHRAEAPSAGSGSDTSLLETVLSASETNQNTVTVASGGGLTPAPPPGKKPDILVDSAKMKPALASVKEDAHTSETVIAAGPSRRPDGPETLEAIMRKNPAGGSSRSVRKYDFSSEALLKGGSAPKPPSSSSSSRKKEAPRPIATSAAQKGLERLLDCDAAAPAGTGRPTTSSHRELALEALKETLGRPTTTSTRYTSAAAAERKQGVILESMHPSEVRAMSGMLSNLVRSASRSRYTLSSAGLKEMGRISTPEGRLMSARLQRLSASRDGRISPSHRLPPVKQKKKSSKRCFVCGKKTSLATSYQCRCSNNFCAAHRYAEAHDCDFDYKTEGRKLLEQSNPVVTAPKLPKI